MRPPRGTAALVLLGIAGVASAADSVHVAYHWHLHQPIYWPETAPGTNRYQFAGDSLNLKLANTGNFYPNSPYKHPRNALVSGDGGEYDSVFDKDDRIAVYQWRGRDAISTLGGYPDAGASVSYSGALMENIWSLGKDSRYGYSPSWNAGYTEARGWKTSGGYPKADMVGMTFHHAFSPLLPKSVLRKEIQIFKEIWWKTWGGNPDKSDHSKGYWPVEAAFSTTIIPVLASEGYEWTIVANSHLARTCSNYMSVAQRGSSGWNIDPPNLADQLGPNVPAQQWWSDQLDGRGGTFPAPFAYQAHKAKYVDPATGQETKITIVPMCDILSYKNGYGTMGTGDIDAHIAPYNDTNHPSIVLLAHDGDNAWGGGYDYFMNSVPQLMNAAAGQGYRPTTIQQFLASHPVPDSDVVQIEDGAWFNAANDWGHPQFINWLWPPTRSGSDPAYNSTDPRTWYDFETPGWTEDWRNWAVLVAGANYCETAEQIAGGAQPWRIQEPTQKNGTNNNPTPAEQAWHYYLGGLDSGFMYYGTSLDDEVKQTLAVNRAVPFAKQVIGDGTGDLTPPTVFKPQRFPWNPGGMGWGPLTGYKEVGFNGKPSWPSDFYIWTHAFDVSGVASVRLFVRADLDGVNPLSNNENETYAGGAGVGAWQAIPMNKRAVPTGNVTGNSQVDFFLQPIAIADYYWAKVTGYRNQLLDYYIEAVDSRGNVTKTDIQHVWVADDGTSTPTPTPTPSPTPTATPTPTPTPDATPSPAGAPVPFVMDGVRDFAGYLKANNGMTLYAAVRGTKLYIATWSTGDSGGLNDHFILVSDSLEAAASTKAPWGKAGLIASGSTKPYLAAESANSYCGWFNAPASARVAKASSASGELEGEIDLQEAFGAVPSIVYLASLAYQTADGGVLASQAPAGDGDGNVDPTEFLAVPVPVLLDNDADGVYDRLDPRLDFRAHAAALGGGIVVTWASVPGQGYQVEYCDRLGTTWNPLPGGTMTATDIVSSVTDLASSGAPQRYYRVKLQ